MMLNIDSGTGNSQFVSISGHVSVLTDINRGRKRRQYQNIFSEGGKFSENIFPILNWPEHCDITPAHLLVRDE